MRNIIIYEQGTVNVPSDFFTMQIYCREYEDRHALSKINLQCLYLLSLSVFRIILICMCILCLLYSRHNDSETRIIIQVVDNYAIASLRIIFIKVSKLLCLYSVILTCHAVF